MDDVRGIVIGGDFVKGTLHKYQDGAQQGPEFYGGNDDEVKSIAESWFMEHGGKSVWPQGLELRLS
jgi:hypothetical protein